MNPQGNGGAKPKVHQPGLTGGVFSKAVLLEVSFPQVLRVANAVALTPTSLVEVMGAIHEASRPSPEIGRLAAEMLLRAGLIDVADGNISGTAALPRLLDALDARNLDAASEVWQSYAPYMTVLSILRSQAVVELKNSHSILSQTADHGSREGNDRLWRIPVYLGQAWNDDGLLRDGSARPHKEATRVAVLALFNDFQNDGLCPVRELLPRLCRDLRMSPWIASRIIQELVEAGMLPELSFQPSAGGKIVARDQIVFRENGEIQTAAVAMDRLEVSRRPVFTISKASV